MSSSRTEHLRERGITEVYLRAPGGKIYEPTVPQLEFHALPHPFRWFVGGVGSGKTTAGCAEAILTALEYPGSVGLVGRYAFRELIATTWSALREMMPRPLVSFDAESQQKCYIDVRAPGGRTSRILGWPLSNISSIYSLTLDWFYVDEAGQVPPSKIPQLWSMLAARLRGTVGPLRGWITGNPNGRDWLYHQFVGRGLRSHGHVVAPTVSNVCNLPLGYEFALRKANGAEWARRFLDAEFNEFEGLVYWNFSEAVHVVDDVKVEDNWPLYIGMDFGLAEPTAAIFIVVDEAGILYCIDEYYEAGKIVSEQCREIRTMLRGRVPEWIVIDPAAGRRGFETGRTLAEQYREHGLLVQEGNNRVLDGVSLVLQHFATDPELTNPFTGKAGSPRLFVHRRCRNLIEQLSSYHWAPDGRPAKGNDHAVDALRYAVMRQPARARPVKREVMRPSAVEFWNQIAREAAGYEAELPYIGQAGLGGLR